MNTKRCCVYVWVCANCQTSEFSFEVNIVSDWTVQIHHNYCDTMLLKCWRLNACFLHLFISQLPLSSSALSMLNCSYGTPKTTKWWPFTKPAHFITCWYTYNNVYGILCSNLTFVQSLAICTETRKKIYPENESIKQTKHIK